MWPTLQSRSLQFELHSLPILSRQPPARRIGSVPGQDPSVELEHCAFKVRSWAPRAAIVACISDDLEESLHALAPHRRDDLERGQVGLDGIDHRGLLTDEELGMVEQQAALLLGASWSRQTHMALVTASQMAAASGASSFCRFT